MEAREVNSVGVGWIGRMDQVLHYLRTVRADQDAEGRFILRGDGVASFMGSDSETADVCVPGSVEYRTGGDALARWCNLATGLGTTSYGLPVLVIG